MSLIQNINNMETKIFPNGFAKWQETHFEICFHIGYKLKANELLYTENIITKTIETMGTTGLYSLAEQWTDEFEQENAGREWDGEFLECVWEFIKKKTLNI